jgi:hypothetical protein
LKFQTEIMKNETIICSNTRNEDVAYRYHLPSLSPSCK